MDRFNLPAFSILGIARFTLLQRHVELAWTIAFSVVVGVVLASAFPAIVVYAQDMMSHRIGMVSGLFYGLSFGLGGLRAGCSTCLPNPSASWSSTQACAFLPRLGLFVVFVADVRLAEPARPRPSVSRT